MSEYYSVGNAAVRWLSAHAKNNEERRAIVRLQDFEGTATDVKLAAAIYARHDGMQQFAEDLRAMVSNG